jgi:hypothetical protein
LICIDGKTINCRLCGKDHLKPSEGFAIIIPLAEMMDLKADRLYFGKNFEYGKNLLNSLDKSITQYTQISHQPKNFINEFFTELKAKCNARREEVKFEVDNYFDQILKEIENHRKECEINSTKIEEVFADLEISASLRDWIKEYDTTSINEETRNRIIFECKAAKLKLEEKLNVMKQKLLKNMNYRIEQKEMIEKKKFGFLVVEKSLASKFIFFDFKFDLKYI